MRQLTYILIILLGLVSCNLADSKTNAKPDNVTTETDILEKLKKQKTSLDTLWNHSKSKLIVLVKLSGKNDLVEVKNDKWPDNIQTTFNLLKDDNGNIIVAKELPYNESGDWDISYSLYFDKERKTFAFERQTNFFNSLCTDGVAYETKTEFYNNDFHSIGKEYKLVDEKNKPLPKDSCVFNYDRDYKVVPNIETYLQTNKIKNGR